MVVEIARRLRLGDVEKAKEGKGGELPEKRGRRHQQHEPEGHDFIPDDAAMIRVAQRLAGDVDEPDAGEIGGAEQSEQWQFLEIGAEQHEAEPGEQRAESARCFRRQPATAAEREEVRRVGEQEGESRLTRQSGRSPCGRS